MLFLLISVHGKVEFIPWAQYETIETNKIE